MQTNSRWKHAHGSRSAHRTPHTAHRTPHSARVHFAARAILNARWLRSPAGGHSPPIAPHTSAALFPPPLRPLSLHPRPNPSPPSVTHPSFLPDNQSHYVTGDLDAKLISDIVDVMKPLPADPGFEILRQVRASYE